MKKRCALISLLVFVLLLSSILPSYAVAPSYTVEIDGTRMAVLQNGSRFRSYRLDEPNLTLSVDSSGNLGIYFYQKEREYLSGIALPTHNLAVTGDMEELKLTNTLDASYTITAQGHFGAISVYGSPRVQIGADSQVIKLLQYSGSAKIMVQSSASIAQTYTPKAPVYTSSYESITNTEAPDTPIFDGNIRNPARPILDVKINSSRDDGIVLNFDESTYTLTVTSSRPGVTVAQAVRGANFTARQPDGSSLEGRWDFHVGSGSSTESGSYVYRFSPASSRYSTIDIKVRFKAREGSASYHESAGFIASAPATVEITPVPLPQVEIINTPLPLITSGYKLPLGASSIKPKLSLRTINVSVPESAAPGDTLRFMCGGQTIFSVALQESQIGRLSSFSVPTASQDQIEAVLVRS